VAAEAVAAAAIRRFGGRMVLAAGAVLLGAPALAMLVPEPQAVMVGVSLVRGLGFGLCGVVTGALTAQLLLPTGAVRARPARHRLRRPGHRRAAGRNLARRTPPGRRVRRGRAVFGLICVRTGYPVGFALTGALILAAVPAAVRQRKAAGTRSA